MCILFYYFIHQHINYKGDYWFNINKLFVVFGIFSYLGNNVGIDDSSHSDPLKPENNAHGICNWLSRNEIKHLE